MKYPLTYHTIQIKETLDLLDYMIKTGQSHNEVSELAIMKAKHSCDKLAYENVKF